MSPLEDAGYWTEGTIGNARHVGEPLSVEQILALPDGAEVVITWSGGNGPHAYRISRVNGVVRANTISNDRLVPDADQRIPFHRVTLAT